MTEHLFEGIYFTREMVAQKVDVSPSSLLSDTDLLRYAKQVAESEGKIKAEELFTDVKFKRLGLLCKQSILKGILSFDTVTQTG